MNNEPTEPITEKKSEEPKLSELIDDTTEKQAEAGAAHAVDKVAGEVEQVDNHHTGYF